jgi:hypothetical protein
MHPTFSLPKRLAHSFQVPARLLTASLLTGSLLGPALLAQPVLVKDILPGPQGSCPGALNPRKWHAFLYHADRSHRR